MAVGLVDCSEEGRTRCKSDLDEVCMLQLLGHYRPAKGQTVLLRSHSQTSAPRHSETTAFSTPYGEKPGAVTGFSLLRSLGY